MSSSTGWMYGLGGIVIIALFIYTKIRGRPLPREQFYLALAAIFVVSTVTYLVWSIAREPSTPEITGPSSPPRGSAK